MRMPASVVSAPALLMAWRRGAMTSAARPWWARQQRSRVERRASGAAVRVGQRRRQSQKIAGIFSSHHCKDVRAGVLEGTGRAIGEPAWVADQATAVFDAVGEGTHGGAVRLHRRALVAVGAEQCDLECRIGGVVCGPAGGERFAGLCYRQRSDRKEPEALIWTQRRYDGALLAFPGTPPRGVH